MYFFHYYQSSASKLQATFCEQCWLCWADSFLSRCSFPPVISVCVVKKIVLHSFKWEFVKSNATQCKKLKIDNMWQQLMHGGTYLWQFPCFAPISVTFCRWTTPITYSSQLKTFLQHAAKRERLSKPFYLDKSTPTLLSQQMHNTICNYQITANIFNKLQCKLITTCANCTLGVQCSLHYV